MVFGTGFWEKFQKKCRHDDSRSVGEGKGEYGDNKNEASNYDNLWYIVHFLSLDSTLWWLFAIVFELSHFKSKTRSILLFHFEYLPFSIPTKRQITYNYLIKRNFSNTSAYMLSNTVGISPFLGEIFIQSTHKIILIDTVRYKLMK